MFSDSRNARGCEALLAECLVTVLTLTSQGLTVFLSLVVYKAGMIYTSKSQPSELQCKANSDAVCLASRRRFCSSLRYFISLVLLS